MYKGQIVFLENMSAVRMMISGIGAAAGIVVIITLTNVGVSLLTGGRHTASSVAETAVGKVF
jgi:hypothetical protein